MNTILQPLYKKDSKGKLRMWQLEIDGEGRYRSIAGLADGKRAISEWTVAEPKNVGRSNETTPADQAMSEVLALYQKKRDKHYVESADQIHDARLYFEVQLAEDYDEYKDRIDFLTKRYFTQPKLDGLRGATRKSGTFSRGGNEFLTVKFISEFLAPVFEKYPELIVDGELYNHDFKDDFNEIVSCIKRPKPKPEDFEKAKQFAQLHVYDCFFPDQPELEFYERYNKLIDIFKEVLGQSFVNEGYAWGPIHVVPTDEVTSFADIDANYDRYLNLGYEGEMVRCDVIYTHKRTKMMLKRKVWVSSEFKLKLIESGSGNWTGAAKRVEAFLEDGRTFGAGVKGKRPYLREVLAEKEKYTWATIEYFEKLTPDGIPRFGRVTEFHEGERTT